MKSFSRLLSTILLTLPMYGYAQNVQLPFEETFDTEEGFSRFTVIDDNGDSETFTLDQLFKAANCERSQDANDWLITPALPLKAGKTYELTYTISGYSASVQEKYEVKMGLTNTVAGMLKEIVGEETAPGESGSEQTIKKTFTVTRNGDYYIGWHYKTTSELNTGALAIYDIKVTQGHDKQSPMGVTDLTAVAASGGALQATISFKAPTKTQTGHTLSSLDKIELVRDSILIHTFTTPTPGQELSYVDNSPANGKHTYIITPYNTAGDGTAMSVDLFVGVDTPSAVNSLNLVYNGQKAILSWDKVTTGETGNYIDPTAITYSLQRNKEGVIAGNLFATSYEDTPTVGEEQTLLWYNVYATNLGGDSKRTSSNVVVTGKPYTLPFYESFKGGKMSKFWWVDYDNLSRWTVSSDAAKFAQDNDKGFVGFTPMKAGEWSTLQSGLINLGNATEPILSFYYRTHTPTSDIFKIMVSKEYASPEEVRIINIDDVDKLKQWIKVEIPLTNYKDSKFIQVSFDYKGTDKNSNIYIDNIRVYDRKSSDLELKSTEFPAHLRTGQPVTFNAKITNYGSERATDYTLELHSGQTKMASIQGPSIEAGETSSVAISFTPSITAKLQIPVALILNYDKDENIANNTSDTIMLTVKYPAYPAPRELGTDNTSGTIITWKAPLAPRAADEQVTESFEQYDNFITRGFGDWITYDVDDHSVYGLNNTDFPGMGQAQAWTVFDYSATTPACNPAWKGYDGNKALVSFGGTYSINENWLVSPELPGTEQTITLWEKSFKGSKNETYNVMYSTTGFERKDFTILESNHVVPAVWSQAQYALPDGTKYFAIVSTSEDGFATLLDEITFVPDSLAEQHIVLKGYNIYRDGQKLNAVPITQTNYRDIQAVGKHRYLVTAVYDKGESRGTEEVEINVVNGIEEIQSANNPATDDRIYDLSGRRVINPRKGVYIKGGKKVIINR